MSTLHGNRCEDNLENGYELSVQKYKVLTLMASDSAVSGLEWVGSTISTCFLYCCLVSTAVLLGSQAGQGLAWLAACMHWSRQYPDTCPEKLPFIICRPRKINFRFMFPFAANKQKFAVSVFHLQQTIGSCCFLLVLFSINIYIYINCHFKRRKPRYIFLNPLLLAHCANGSLLFVGPSTKEQTEVIHLQMN